MKHYILKINFLLILFSLFLTSSFCQNPGYLGKHLILKYNNYFNFYWAKDHKGNVEYQIPMRHHLGLALIVQPNITIDAFYTTGKTNFRINSHIGIIESMGGEFGVTFFKNAFAPLGYYTRLGFEFSTSDWSLKNNSIFFDDKTKGEFNNSIISMELGKSGILYDRLCYSFGAQYGIRIESIFTRGIKNTEIYPKQRLFYQHLWSIHFGLGFLLF
jgi:hypothetical protein